MENKLPKNWVECTLNDLSQIQSGGTPSRANKDYWNGNIPWIKISDIKDLYVENATEFITEEGLKNSATRIFPEGTILFTIFATIGRIGILKIAATTNQAIAGITPSKLINHKYLTYSLIDLSNSISESGKGVAQKNINQAILKETLIPLPPLAEQNRIVAKLDALFAQHEAIKTSMAKIPELLKNFRQQVLTQAVTGKLTNNKIEEKRLGDLLIDVKYGTSMKSEYEIDGTPIFRIPNIDYGEINASDLKFSILSDKEYNQLKLVEGDVLIIRSNGSVNLVGRSAIIRKKHEGYSYAGYLIRLRCGEELNSEFLNYTLKSEFLRRQIVKTSHSSSGVNNINSQEIKDLKIYWTKPKEQQEIVNRVESLFAKADAIEQQYQNLKTKIDILPQAILHKAFKGELTEQLDSDGDAKALLKQIKALQTATTKTVKSKKKPAIKKVKLYPENDGVLDEVAEGNVPINK